VLAAVGGASPRADDALAALYESYWYPLYAFLRNRGHGPDAAQDLTQAFFTRLIDKERRVLRQADPERGRFRSFLLTSLKNFTANEHERDVARKRGGGAPLLSLEFETAEGRFQHESPSVETPERVFDRRWAITLLGRALSATGERARRTGKAEQFEQLKVYLTGEQLEPGYEEVARRLGMSEGAVKVAVHRLRRQFRDFVREEIASTVDSPDDIEDEMRHLWAAVAR
jgi:RNA polymerase sigma-70 factor (ECF subfamily)